MKLKELKKKFANKYVIRVVAGVLTIALLGSSMTAVAVQAEPNTDTEESAESEDDGDEDEFSDMISVSTNEEDAGKEESVYLLSDASGSVYDTIVTNHLVNREGEATLADRSSLRDIENTKGNESYTADGEKLTWQADGNDIYYRGTTAEEAPVSQKITYYLDGEEISPEQLAGKSGRVTIHYDYENTSSFTETVNGEKYTVKVPFAAISVLALGEGFSNVEVTNGKLMQNGDSAMVVGYALPGMKESLDVDEDDFDEEVNLPEYFEMSADVENFELDTAMTIVMNAGGLLSMEQGDDESMDDMIDELQDAMGQLKDGSNDLAEGMDTLQSSLADYADGMSELNSGSGDLAAGVTTLSDSAAGISAGIATLDQGLNTPMSESEQAAVKEAAAAAVSEQFANGQSGEVAKQIYQALRYTQTKDGKVTDGELYAALYDSAYSSNAGTAVYNEVVRQVLLSAAGQSADSSLTADQAAAAILQAYAEGAQAGDPTSTAVYAVAQNMSSAQLAEFLYAQSGAKDTLFAKTQSTIQEQMAAGRNNGEISAGVEQSLNALATQLAGACEEVASQAAQSAVISGAESAKQSIAAQIESAQAGGYSLVTGAEALSDGTKTLADQVPSLTDGITQLNDATGQIVDGVDELADGSHELADGIVEFDEEGISKLIDSYNGDMKPLLDRLQAMLDAGEDYQTFTGLADGVTGSVKFIYKLDAIKPAEEE